MARKHLSRKKVSRAINMAWKEQMEAIRNTHGIANLCDRIALEREAEDLLHLKKTLRRKLEIDGDDGDTDGEE